MSHDWPRWATSLVMADGIAVDVQRSCTGSSPIRRMRPPCYPGSRESLASTTNSRGAGFSGRKPQGRHLGLRRAGRLGVHVLPRRP